MALQFFKDSVDLRSRLINALPKDGMEAMEAPLPLQAVATGSLPAASAWEGALIYDATTNRVLWSNGTNWLTILNSVDLDDVMLLDGTNQMEAPLPLQEVATGSLPAAGSWEGSIIYDSTRDLVVYSDGSSWHKISGRSPVTIASGNASGSSIVITDIPQDFSAIHLQLNSVSCDTATRHLQIQSSEDNGSNYSTTASDYIGFTVADTGTLTYINEASYVQTADVAAGNNHLVGISFHGYNVSGHVTAVGRLSNGTTNYACQCTLAKFNPFNALRVIWNGSGNFDNGTYALYGIY